MSDENRVDHASYAPFTFTHPKEAGKGCSLLLSDVDMVAKCPIFEERKEGWNGNGYDWNSIAQVVMEERLPELQEQIDFDPEAGMFCALGQRAPLEKLAVEMHKVFHDDALLRDLLSRAELD